MAQGESIRQSRPINGRLWSQGHWLPPQRRLQLGGEMGGGGARVYRKAVSLPTPLKMQGSKWIRPLFLLPRLGDPITPGCAPPPHKELDTHKLRHTILDIGMVPTHGRRAHLSVIPSSVKIAPSFHKP